MPRFCLIISDEVSAIQGQCCTLLYTNIILFCNNILKIPVTQPVHKPIPLLPQQFPISCCLFYRLQKSLDQFKVQSLLNLIYLKYPFMRLKMQIGESPTKERSYMCEIKVQMVRIFLEQNCVNSQAINRWVCDLQLHCNDWHACLYTCTFMAQNLNRCRLNKFKHLVTI